MQRPSTIFDAISPDTYGQEFTLEGQSADDSDVGRIEVNIYRDEECTDWWDTVVLSKVAPTVDMTVMKWIPETTEVFKKGSDGKGAKYENGGYKDLYGTDIKAGSQTYYCTITAYDDARPCPDDGTGKGNSTDYYYLYNDIYTPILSKYKLTQVYSILNGTYNSGNDREVIDSLASVKETLASESKRIRKGSFALNPLNNPTFSFSGYDPLEKKESGIYSFEEVINGSIVTVKVSSGLDKIPLVNDTIGVGFIPVDPAEPLNKDGTVKASGDEVKVFLPAADKDGKVLIADEKNREDRALQIVNVGSYDRTIAITLSKKDGLKVGQYYVLNVTAYDEKGNNAFNNGILYGFKFKSMGGAPKLNVDLVTDPANDQNFVNLHGKVKITGTTTHEEGTPEYSIYLGEFDENDLEKNRKVGPITDTNIDSEFNAADLFQSSEGVKTFTVYSSYDNNWTKLEQTVTYDFTPPTVTVTSVSPIVRTYTVGLDTYENCVNGKITINGNIFDKNGIDSVSFKTKYKDKDADDKDAIEFDSGATSDTDYASYFEINNIDTTKAPDEKELIVIISVKDKAGNVNDYKVKTTNTNKNYFIWQESDKPVINFTGLNVVSKSNDPKLSGFTKASNITFTLTDDDGLLKDGTMKIFKYDGITEYTESNKYPKKYNDSDFTGGVASFTLPGTTGVYKISLTVSDMYGTQNTKETYLKVESGEPSLEINSGNKTYITQTGNGNKNLVYELAIAGEIDKEELDKKSFKVYIAKEEDLDDDDKWMLLWDSKGGKDINDKDLHEGIDKVISGTIKVTVPTSFTKGFEAGYHNDIVYLIAKDARTTLKTTKPVSFGIDNNLPKITKFNLPDAIKSGLTNYDGIQFEGNASDGIGVEEVKYQLKKEDEFDSNNESLWVTANGTTIWKFYEEFKDENANGKYKLKIKALDRANNYVESAEYEFTVDTISPNVSDVKLGGDGKTITAKINDGTGTGIKTVELYDDVKAVASENYILTEPTAGSDGYKLTLKSAAFTEGKHTFKVRATDKAGNLTTAGNIEITVAKPKTTATSTSLVNGYIKGGDKINITVACTDDSAATGVAKTYAWKKGDANVTAAANKTSWTDEIEAPSTSGEQKVKYSVTNIFGQTGEVEFNYIVDVDAPTVTVGKPGKDDTKAASYTFVGTTKETGSGIKEVKMTISDKANSTKKETFTLGTSANWSQVIKFSEYSGAGKVFEDEGEKTVSITATDNVGNSQTYDMGTFTYDKANPTITVKTTFPKYIPASGVILDATIADSYKVNTDAIITVKETYTSTDGKVTEKSGTFKKGDSVLTESTENKEYTANIKLPLDRASVATGIYEYSFTVKDSVGNEVTTQTYSRPADLTEPTISITSPATKTVDGVTKTDIVDQKNYRFAGEAKDEDDVSGIAAVYYQIVAGETSVTEPSAPTADFLIAESWTDLNWKAATSKTWNFSQKFVAGNTASPATDELKEGQYNIFVYAVDNAGNVSKTVQKANFQVDLSYPTISAPILKDTAITPASITPKKVSNQDTVTEAYILSFTIGDTRGLGTYGTGSAAKPYAISIYKDGSTTAMDSSLYNVAEATGGTIYSKTYTVTIPSQADGLYTYEIKAVDIVGKETTITKTIRKDTKAPTLEITTPTFGNGKISEWQSQDNISIKGTAIDDSGVHAVYYSTDSSTSIPNEPLKEENWIGSGKKWLKAEGTTVWTIEPPSSGWNEGSNSIYIVAVDNCGMCNPLEEYILKVDVSAPSLEIKANKDGSNTTSIENTTGANPYYANAKDTNGVTLLVNATDKKSGINTISVTYRKDTTTGTLTKGSDGTYKLTDEGTYSLTITAKDKAGNETQKTATIIIDKTAPIVSVSSLPNKDDTKVAAYTFVGSTTEAGSGIESISMTISDKADSNKSETFVLATSENWSQKVIYADYSGSGKVFEDEGEKIVSITVTDKAGNTATYDKGSFVYDKADPTFVLKSALPQYMPTSGLNINATVKDTYKLDLDPVITVSETHGGTTSTAEFKIDADGTLKVKRNATGDFVAITGSEITKTDVEANKEYTVNIKLPINGATVSNGKYTYSFAVKDANKNSFNTQNYDIIADLQAPTINIKSPEATGDIIDQKNYRFAGDAKDEDEGSGLMAVYYQIIAGDASVEAPNPPTENLNTEASWTTKGWKKASSVAWNFLQKFVDGDSATVESDEMREGQYNIFVYAVDNAGNRSKNVQRANFKVDLNAPKVVTTLHNTADGTNTTNDKTLTTNATETKTAGHTFKFTVSDTNGLDSTKPYTLVVKKDDTVLTTGYSVNGNIDASGRTATYTVTINNKPKVGGGYEGQLDGLYTYEVTAKDKVGKESTTETRNVRLDTTGPEISFSSPTFTNKISDWQSSKAVKVIGGAEDVSGVHAVYYTTTASPSVPSTATDALNGDKWTDWTKITDGTTNWSFTKTFTNEGETAGTIIVAAVDKYGNLTKSDQQTIKIDTAPPVIGTTTYKIGSATAPTELISGSTIYANGKIDLSGTVSDANGVKGVTIVAKKDSTEKTATVTGTTSWKTSFTVKDDATAGTTGDLSDGTWTITLTVTDVADKSTIATYTVVVDTAPPTLSPAYKSGTETFPAAWTNKTSVTVTTGAADTGSGLASAYYYAGTKSTTTDISENEWLPMVNTTGTTVTLFENAADQYIHLKVVDRAGNAATTKSSAFTIDTSKPSAEITSHANGSFIGSNADVVITISASDVISKLKPNDTTDATKSGVYVTVMNGSTTVGTYTATLDSGVYKATIPSTALSALGRTVETIKVTAKATDNAGNSQDSSPIDLKFDRTNPTVTLRSPIASSTVNGKIEISGSASDDRMLKKVTLYRTPKTGETGTNVTIKTIDKDTSSAETKSLVAITGGLYEKEAANSWTISDFDTTTIASETLNNFEIYAVAEDDYGNKNYAVSKIKIDQHTDRPTITFSDLKLTTGEGSSKAPMSSSNYVWQINSLDVRGTITDDDGIAEFKYIVKSPSEAAPDETALAAGSSIPVNNGSWKITIPEENQGERVVYFYVKDTAGKSFYTKTSNDTSGIYLTDGNATYGTNETGYGSSVLYVKVDTNPPEASLEGATVASTIDENTTWTTTWASVKLGGTTTSFKFLVKAKDDNGIKSVNAKASGTCLSTAKEISSTLQKEKTFKVGGNTVTTDSDGKDNNGYSWYLFNVDCSTTNGFESGTLDFKVTVEDNAGTKSERTATFEIDYTVPVVRPNEVSTQLNGGGMVSLWGTVDTIQSKLYMAMSKSASDLPTDALVSGKSTAWDLVTESSGMSYYLYFDNDTSNPDKSHKQQLNNYLYNLGITTAEAVANNTYTDITNLYLWIKAVDLAGNVSTTSTMIRIDPQGDRPTIEISYPSTTTGTVGGELRIMGSATDNEAVSTVWVQVISKEHNYKIGTGTGEFNITGKTFRLGNTATPITNYTPTADDLDYMVHCGMSVYKFADYKESDSDANKAKLLWTDSSADRTNPELYAAKANFTGSTWNLIINDKGQFDPATGESNLVGITAYSVDAKTPKANVSLPTTVSVTFDADNPVISNLYLKQFSENTITANREYSDNNMYVKGVWYLTGTVSDTNGINGLTIGDDELVKEGAKQTNDAKWEITEWKDATSDKNAKTVSFKYLLTTGEADSVGTWAKTLKATDNADGTKHTGSKLLTINYDNKSPVLATSGNGYNIDEKIQQSNGFYTFGSVVTESPVGTTSQSGFERLAFYFTRTLGSTTNIYDPILGKSATGHTNATSELTLSEGLYWKTKTVTRNSTNLDTLTLPAADQNIRKGGIVKIGGTIYKILSVSGTTVTIDGSPLYSNPTETAYFALAQIVDNTAAEMGNTSGSDLYYTAANDVNGYYKTIYNDDGDYMVEAVQLTNLGATATWEAQINSQNIPDGPITLHYVAFDKAGNVASTSVDGFVSNNMPRIAGLKFGTDDNGNGTVEDKEMVTSWSGLYSFDKTGFVNGYSSNKDKVTELIVSNATDSDGTNAGTLDGNSVLKIKGVTKIVPEIVGGNNGVGYTYSVTKSGATTPYHEKAIYTELSTAHSDTNDIRSGLNINLSIQEMLGKPSGVTTTIEDGEKQIFEFSIWDKTDGVVMTDGKPKAEGEGRSQRAIVKMIMDVALVDTTKPTAKIKPFYWNKHGKPDTDSSGNTTSHNSIYWDDDNTALGHIELEDDLPSIFNQSSGVMDRDPKVSGMIVIDGAANDNTIIKTLRIKIPGFNGGNFFVIAERDNDGNLAPKQSGALSDTNTWACEIVSDTFTQANGNDVAFKFYWDTSKITNVAVTDVKVEVQASDRGKTTWKSGAVAYENAQTSDSSTTQTATGAETPYYKMDVVPYVTKISTTNRTASGLKDNNIRSASGKYSVIKGSTTDFVTVEGFNFKSGSVTARIVATDSLSSATTLTGSAVSNISVSDTRKFTFSNNLSKSGYLEVWANEIRALNNINNDGAKGAYTGNGSNKVTDYPNMYNREPDLYTTKNITLTDDRYIRVFDMKDTEIKNGYYPTMIMDGNDPVFGYIDLNGINKNQPGNPTRVYVDGCYQFQRAKFNATTGKTSDIEYLAGAISWDQMAMARDSAGKYFQVSAYNYNDANISLVYDKYAEQHTWLYNYRTTYTDGWGGGTGYNGYGGIFSYDSNNNAIDFESLSYGNGNLIGRYQNFRLVVKGNSETADGASVYVAYYDDNTTNKDVVFRTLKVGQDTSWRNTNTLKNGYSNCPDKNTSGRITVGSNASSYLDLGVTNSNIPVVVYYDINDSRLKLKYASAAVDGSTITPNITWTASSVVFPEYVGNYVTMYIDSNDHIHIAAFNTSDSDLVYMYLDSYNSSEFKSVTVDQANSVGYWTQIKVKNNVPYIAYYNSTETGSRESIKYAYFNGTITSKNDVKSGVDGNGYTTGDWEYITVPSLTPAQGGDAKFKCVNIDFDSSGRPVVGYLGTNIEFGKALDE